MVLRSRLRLAGRWQVVSRGTLRRGRPWLVLRGDRLEARQFTGPSLELAVCAAVVRLMRCALTGGRSWTSVYRRAVRPCRRCGTAIRSCPQGDGARLTYWCPGCQGPAEAGAGAPGAYL